ncbi:hypothetical protein BTHE_1452 [Bifidobacterium thermophilum]|nr:hypothetical protein BTHE_1452 [Bifidobacterium thermophilum]
MECHFGPARYRFESTGTVPVRSAFTERHSTGSNAADGSGGHMLLLRFEQAGDGHAEPVMVGLREPFARVEPRASPVPGVLFVFN